MGAKHSTEPRTVYMENTNIPAGVIDISDEVVGRLKLGLKKQAKSNSKASSSGEINKNELKTAPVSPSSSSLQSVPLSKQPTIVYQNAPPLAYAGPGGITITAADIRRQKEEELKQNDAMWRQRMSQLEENLKKTNAIMEKEYMSAVDDVRKRFATAPPTHQLPPCQELKMQVIACYRSSRGETLNCAEQVAAFRNCVNVQRFTKLDVDKHKEGKDTQTILIKAKGA